ncbi:MAG: TauD/TfdA family dioxygenase [Pirellulales bacterium]|nr:TauD/TfdA family dioxygenase [Pirellulales bacterium]
MALSIDIQASRPVPSAGKGAFDLKNESGYRKWRETKLAGYPRSLEELTVPVGSLAAPTEGELDAIVGICRRANMAVYAVNPDDLGEDDIRHALHAFAARFGLEGREGHRSAADDGIVALQVSDEGSRKGYIPYSNRSLNWHTDGYYNEPERRIRAFVLHCVRAAGEGGENGLLDPEIAYIRLRDTDPEYVSALSHPQAMTIPANIEPDGSVRPANTGPVFSVDPESGCLQMRFTARARHIVWRDDPVTSAAVDCLVQLLKGDDPLIFRHRMAPGQGLICNNVLHSRSAFTDGSDAAARNGRLLYRMRYSTRIAGTDRVPEGA